jgi:hypothetical protein
MITTITSYIVFREANELHAEDYINGLLNEGEDEDCIMEQTWNYMDNDECGEFIGDNERLLTVIEDASGLSGMVAVRDHFDKAVANLFPKLKRNGTGTIKIINLA